MKEAEKHLQASHNPDENGNEAEMRDDFKKYIDLKRADEEQETSNSAKKTDPTK